MNDLLLAVYFIFILDYRNDVRQKAYWNNFLIEFKMGGKAVETTRNITNTFGPGTANEHTVQWWFKKLCRGDAALKMRSTVASHRKVKTTTVGCHRS